MEIYFFANKITLGVCDVPHKKDTSPKFFRRIAEIHDILAGKNKKLHGFLQGKARNLWGYCFVERRCMKVEENILSNIARKMRETFTNYSHIL